MLVSGDGDLLEADLTDVEVLTPRAFIDSIESTPPS
jgi:predicted nucleic acid-binding protein